MTDDSDSNTSADEATQHDSSLPEDSNYFKRPPLTVVRKLCFLSPAVYMIVQYSHRTVMRCRCSCSMVHDIEITHFILLCYDYISLPGHLPLLSLYNCLQDLVPSKRAKLISEDETLPLAASHKVMQCLPRMVCGFYNVHVGTRAVMKQSCYRIPSKSIEILLQYSGYAS